MKSDSTTMVLNFVLVLLAVLGVCLAIITFMREHDLGVLRTQAAQDQNVLVRMQNLVGQVEAYSQKNPDPKLTAILQSITKPAPQK